jgi:hypothetical protein
MNIPFSLSKPEETSSRRLRHARPDAPTLSGLAHQSILAAWCDLGALVTELEAFLPVLLCALRSERPQVRTAARDAAVRTPLHTRPRCRHSWTGVERAPALARVTRVLVPMRRMRPGTGLLPCRLWSAHGVRQARCRLLDDLPADPARCTNAPRRLPVILLIRSHTERSVSMGVGGQAIARSSQG